MLLEFIVQNLLPQSTTFLLSLVLSVAFVLYVILKTPNGRAPEPSPPPAADGGTEK